jgi:signal transduction histidine kinase
VRAPSPLRTERRILVGGLLLGLSVQCGVGWLVVRALEGASAAEADRHRAVAERLFDEMEGELSALLEREEARSFLEYRFYYVPEGNANYALVQSELSKFPEDPAIVGWFQVDPGNVVSTPLVPRDNELGLANEQNSWTAEDRALAVRDELRRVLEGIPGWSEAALPAPRVAPLLPRRGTAAAVSPRPAPAPSAPSPMNSFFSNRGVSKRADRKGQVVSTNPMNLAAWNYDNTGDGSDQAEPVQQQQIDARHEPNPPPQQARQTEPQQGAGTKVEVSPLSGLRQGEYLVLHRLVRASERIEHRQGLVLRIAALEQRLQRAVLRDNDLQPYVSLAWDGAVAEPRAYTHAHRFAEPFTAMAVRATMDRVPALVGREAMTVRVLALALVLVMFGGGLALYRAVRTQLEYARRRSDFVAAVSHELKTPLTTIRLYAEMLRDGMVPTPERQRTYHHTITMESDRLGRLIANVLELARLERGGPAPEPLVGALAPVVAEAAEIVRPHAAQAGFAVTVRAAPDLPPVRIDRDAVVQIVVNLVDNAVKFAAAGERRVEIDLGPGPGGKGVALAVRDHGPGVPRRQVRRVFEPFWRAERELTRRTQGTGIGLALVRGLAQRMRATVTARNHPEGGFEVRLVLPASG